MHYFLIFLTYLLITNLTGAEEVIRVGLEEAPPLIVKDGSGILNKVLKEVEKRVPYKFSIEYMTYGRAIVELKKKRLDLIGITPTGNETKDFYSYAEDLAWSFQTHNIIFFRSEDKNKKSLSEFTLLGTPPGNEDFMVEMLNQPRKKFHGGSLPSLFKMLKKGRLDGVVFESISSITTLKQMNLKGIEYKKLDKMFAGFSVRIENRKLKEALEKAFREVNVDKFFAPVLKLQKLNDIPFLKVD